MDLAAIECDASTGNRKRCLSFDARCWCPAVTRRRCERRPAGTGSGCRGMARRTGPRWCGRRRVAPDAVWLACLGVGAGCVRSGPRCEALRALGEGRAHAAVSLGEAKGSKLAFLFTGQGAQRLGMGRALLGSCAAFRAAFEEACGHFDELLEDPAACAR